MSSAIEGIAATTRVMYSRQAYAETPPLTARVVSPPRPVAEAAAPEASDREERSAFTPPIDETRSEVTQRLQEYMEEGRPDIASVVEAANYDLELKSHSLRFRVNPQSEDIQIQVVDTERDKIIRSIPADDMIVLAAKMRELAGVGAMVDHSR